MDQWLVRTAKNWIGGPYSKEQVQQMILQGRLTSQDEVCLANQYWIYLHESEEIRKALGIQVPRKASLLRGEGTPTTVESTDDESTDPDLSMGRGRLSGEESENLRQFENSHVSDTTSVLNMHSLRGKKQESETEGAGQGGELGSDGSCQSDSQQTTRVIQAKPRKPRQLNTSPRIPQIEIIGHVERPSIWRVFIWILLVASVGVVVLILQFFKSH